MNPLRRFFNHLLGGAGVVGIALFFLVFSCSRQLPTTPEARFATFNPGQLNLIIVNPGQLVSVNIGPAGDTLAFPVATDSAYLIVPPGALDSNVTFNLLAEVSRTTDGLIAISMYDFGPSGLVFKNDCYLVHPTRLAEGTDIPLHWFDPVTKSWVLEGTAPVKNGKATFVIKHFSDYSAPLDGLGSGGQ
jgi:hypothetical protein